ncbi:type VII secretion-associated serine protease [Streptomyces aureoverticillatus]|nr:type VII secretion-associated serine protease [Streptomyces aureoverticillatus]
MTSEDVLRVESEVGRHDGGAALFSGPAGRRVVSVGSAVSALVAMSVGLAPGAAGADVQSKQWYLKAMRADAMWKVSTGQGIKVAVVDSGVAKTPSLEGRVHSGKDVTGQKGGVRDDYNGHGTTMAELIVGSGRGGGLKGLAPGAEVISFRTSLSGFGKKESDAAEAIRAAADSDAQIISMSIGGDYLYPNEKEAVKYAASKGKLMFAGVGNDAEEKNFVGYPAAYRNVVGVSAADKTGKVARFSEFGDYVDLAAPGLDIPRWCDASFRSYCDNGGGGTSAATALASASAALIWSKHPDWTANQVLRVLIDTASRSWPKDKPSDYLGYGLVRPSWHLVKGQGKPGPAGVDPLTNEKTPVVAGSSPSSSSKESSARTSPPSKGSAGGEVAASVSSSKSKDNDNQLWIVVGAVAAAAVIGGGAFAVVRNRRSA